MSGTVRAYINRENLRYNATVLKNCCGAGVKLCAEVKADAYGHGAGLVVSCLVDLVDMFAVASIEEAEEIYPLLQDIQDKPILVHRPLFAGMEAGQIKLAQARGFHCTVCSQEGLRYAAEQLDDSLPGLKTHLQIDTGMGRMGCRVQDGFSLLKAVQSSVKFDLQGVYTHFAIADEKDLGYTNRQLAIFNEFLAGSGLDKDSSVIKHAANTAATLRVAEAQFDMVRCGIGLYGYDNLGQDVAKIIELRPALRVETSLVLVKDIQAGQSCGYGRTFVAERDMRIGIAPVGYADGLFRNLSNRAVLRCGKHELAIVGRISMDSAIIDLSELPGATEGMKITVIDDRINSYCNAAALAKTAGTIPHEILTAIGNRVKRELSE